MGKYLGSVAVTGFIAPTDTSDTYATHDSVLGRGGLREVATLIERDAIPADRRRIGMIVYVIADTNYYALFGDTTNLSWKNLGSQLGGYDALVDAQEELEAEVAALASTSTATVARVTALEAFVPSYDISLSLVSTLESSEPLYVGVMPYDLSPPVPGTCIASAKVYDDATLDIQLDGVSIGSIVFQSTSPQGIVTIDQNTSINKTSILTIIAPNSVTNLADIGVYLTFLIRETV